mmetsp:Transcript_17506/g.54412  ORF Transcript_17506/g.54412 Transcript_17506/m.54412 type:complete len:233 (+) Transcript_17506:697-1395(+)
MHVVQHNARAVGVERAGRVVHDGSEDDPRLRRRDLDVCADGAALARLKRVRLRPLAQLQIANGCELEAEVRHRLGGLVDNEHIEHDVVLVHCHKGLGVDGVRHARELRDALESLREVLLLVVAVKRVRRAAGHVVVVNVHVDRAVWPELAQVEQRVDLAHLARGQVGLLLATLARRLRRARAAPARLPIGDRRRVLGTLLDRLALLQHGGEGSMAVAQPKPRRVRRRAREHH